MSALATAVALLAAAAPMSASPRLWERVRRGLARRPPRARRRRLPADRGAAPAQHGPRPRAPARGGRGRQLLPLDRAPAQPRHLRRDPVAHPRDHHACVPAIAAPARPRGVARGAPAPAWLTRANAAGERGGRARPRSLRADPARSVVTPARAAPQ